MRDCRAECFFPGKKALADRRLHLLFSPFAVIFFVTTSRDLMADLLEATMELVGGKEWSFEALAVPQMGHVPSTDINKPITMENFLSNACRRCDGIRTATLMFDFHPKVPEFGGLARLGELIQQGEIHDLPAPLSLNGNLPARAKMGIIVHNLEDGTMHVLKILQFADEFAVSSVVELLLGQCLHSCLPAGSLVSSEGHPAPAGAYTRISSPESRGAEATPHSEELVLTMDSGR